MRFAAVFAAVLSLGLAAVAAPTAGVQSLEVASVAPMGVVARDVSAPLVARVDAEAASITTLPARDEDFITFLKGKQAQIKTVTDDIRAKTGAKETNIDAYKPDISQIIAYIDDITASTKVHISKKWVYLQLLSARCQKVPPLCHHDITLRGPCLWSR
ncbi:hypothetical protein BOTBODRAFT_452548 [Botryobasidium botryosum FD-172 SS1]|uniref:Inhibitor I9 domain-containing protein n=1 Tax=Botryobasidium botryosum (strain FD-172 SS1) TaxID=930990 RepID=A0A067MJ10_BOTB1|nr:hypothetical protein BOTBODRAFT_452548 [Botryobasidium botryosum FD-172 SS1]